jgi:Leucine-rich repeat (LRR) protein
LRVHPSSRLSSIWRPIARATIREQVVAAAAGIAISAALSWMTHRLIVQVNGYKKLIISVPGAFVYYSVLKNLFVEQSSIKGSEGLPLQNSDQGGGSMLENPPKKRIEGNEIFEEETQELISGEQQEIKGDDDLPQKNSDLDGSLILEDLPKEGFDSNETLEVETKELTPAERLEQDLEAWRLEGHSPEEDCEEACKRIVNVFEYKYTVLRLDGLGLTSMPLQLEQLTALQQLSLSGNRLESLPDGLFNLAQLGILHLGGNNLKELSSKIGRLARLWGLSLAGNQLKSLPSEIGNLSRLAWLSVAENPLTTLPPEIGRLSLLKRLSIPAHDSFRFPMEITKLSELDYLYFSDLDMWEKDHRAQLTVSDLDYTSIQQIPVGKSVYEFTHFRALFPYGNQLRYAPLAEESVIACGESIGLVEDESDLSTEEVSIDLVEDQSDLIADDASVDRYIRDLGRLRRNLNTWLVDPSVTGHKLEACRRILAAFRSQGKVLMLGGLKLSGAPSMVSQLNHLTHLSLTNNHLSSLDGIDFRRLTSLYRLSVSGNSELATLPLSLGQASSLQEVIIEGTKLSKDAFQTIRDFWEAILGEDGVRKSALWKKMWTVTGVITTSGAN